MRSVAGAAVNKLQPG